VRRIFQELEELRRSTLRTPTTAANHGDADDGCQESGDGCGSDLHGDGGASAARPVDRLAGVDADGARRASEDVHESLPRGGAGEHGARLDEARRQWPLGRIN
jgi:hypothetical protein